MAAPSSVRILDQPFLDGKAHQRPDDSRLLQREAHEVGSIFRYEVLNGVVAANRMRSRSAAAKFAVGDVVHVTRDRRHVIVLRHGSRLGDQLLPTAANRRPHGRCRSRGSSATFVRPHQALRRVLQTTSTFAVQMSAKWGKKNDFEVENSTSAPSDLGPPGKERR